jgi:hypothetical protein
MAERVDVVIGIVANVVPLEDPSEEVVVVSKEPRLMDMLVGGAALERTGSRWPVRSEEEMIVWAFAMLRQ